jgi:tripartite-type tricarboxylate transporter receptor subunit TctC
MIKLAKSRPGKLNYGSSGTGTFAHLSFASFNSMSGVQIQHIPYKGNGPATVALLGGQVQFMMGAQPAAMPHVRAKRLVPLGITSQKRSPLLPDVAAIAEFLPGYEFTQGFGILAPAGTPQGIVEKLNKKIVEVLNTPEVRKSLLNQGAVPTTNTSAEYAEYIRAEISKLAKVVKDAGA